MRKKREQSKVTYPPDTLDTMYLTFKEDGKCDAVTKDGKFWRNWNIATDISCVVGSRLHPICDADRQRMLALLEAEIGNCQRVADEDRDCPDDVIQREYKCKLKEIKRLEREMERLKKMELPN